LLPVENIQGNVIPGFNKDFQALLFLKIVEGEEPNFRRWLKSLAPRITSLGKVLAFKRMLKEETEKQRGEPLPIKVTWINIAFSYSALRQLGAIKDADFRDAAFKEGLWRRSESLGDPTGERAEDHRQNWVVGGQHNEADVVLIIASDDRYDLFDEVTWIETSIYAPRTAGGEPDRSGVQIIFKQYGANLPGTLAGHEHFGFRDGVSQPGLRGLLSKDPLDVLTPRQNPEDPNQGKPGQDLLWPGEFVFGYPGQDARKKVEEPGEISDAGPPWAQDGSFLVFRRLRQDVGSFHEFLHDTAQGLKIDPGLFGAKCVGRWTSGAPILHAPEQDDAELAKDDLKNNDFEFRKEDRKGRVCPFASHIRKVYPRDDEKDLPAKKQPLNERITQTHRLLRRGIPYGAPSPSSPNAPLQDSVDRGLLFLAYQTSIEEQFEFVQKQANNPDFKERGAGYDPIIGQNGRSKKRERQFTLFVKGRKEPVIVPINREWVIPTGGGYFFSPSIRALHMLAKR